MILDGADYFVRITDFPVCSSGGMIIPNDDGTYSIYINARCSLDQQRNSYKHEIKHIEHDDFFRSDPVEILESEAG